VIRRPPNSYVPLGRIHCRAHGYKGSLLNVREREIQRGAWWAQVESGSRERCFLSQILLKLTLIYEKGKN
jgi:hypothetical protein